MGGGSKPAGNTTTTTKSDPWDKQQPFLESGFDNIATTFGLTKGTDGKYSGTIDPNALPSYYPGSTIAGNSPETNLALQARTGRALYGSPLTTAAQNQLTSTLNGDYLNSNPYIDATYNQAADNVVNKYNEITNPGIDSAFAKGNRFGSNAYASSRNQSDRTAAQELGNLATNIYGQNYANERQNQIQGQLYAPDLANQDYYDINQLSTVGDYNTNLAQAQIDADREKYNYNASKPLTALQTYQQMIQGDYGGTSTQSNPYYRNSSGSTLGNVAQIAATVGPFIGASDINLKENIVSAGTDNGHNIYEFNYKGRPHKYVGVMAQSVAETHPEAVSRHPSGFLMVNYDMIGVKMRRIS